MKQIKIDKNPNSETREKMKALKNLYNFFLKKRTKRNLAYRFFYSVNLFYLQTFLAVKHAFILLLNRQQESLIQLVAKL